MDAYNHLNQPTEIMVARDTLSGSITYLYDAEGNKLQKQVLEGQALTTTDYLNTSTPLSMAITVRFVPVISVC